MQRVRAQRLRVVEPTLMPHTAAVEPVEVHAGRGSVSQQGPSCVGRRSTSQAQYLAEPNLWAGGAWAAVDGRALDCAIGAT